MLIEKGEGLPASPDLPNELVYLNVVPSSAYTVDPSKPNAGRPLGLGTAGAELVAEAVELDEAALLALLELCCCDEDAAAAS